MARVADFISILQAWAPPALAWDKDNIGLLVGAADSEVRRVLVCLDVTPEVLTEAIDAEVQLIVAHHPLIFRPLHAVRSDSRLGGMIATALRHNIAIIAVHTNADAVRGGINTELAALLGLRDCRALEPARGHDRRLEVLVAADAMPALPLLRAAIEAEGRGYHISGDVDGGARVDITVPAWDVASLRGRLQRSFSEYNLLFTTMSIDTTATAHGIGLVGDLAKALTEEGMIALVKDRLDCDAVRVSTGYAARHPQPGITRVAVCGGAGSSYVRAAIAAGAQCYVTGDLGHHTFLDHGTEILLIDAGHHHTEKQFVRLLCAMLESMPFEEKQKIDILPTRTTTNPLRFA